jgi:hypothetical protein
VSQKYSFLTNSNFPTKPSIPIFNQKVKKSFGQKIRFLANCGYKDRPNKDRAKQ